MKFYSGGDYRSAIREFSAAQQLAPADLNNYNLALCYDKLGDPEPAIQYYRAYLDKQPGTDKRAEIEASVTRLEMASKSVAAKKAEEARKIEEARKADEMRRAGELAKQEEMRRAEEARRAEDARRAEEARRATESAPRPIGPAVGVPGGPGPVGPGVGGPIPVGPGVGGSMGGGSTGTPGSAMPAPTGDAQLDRVQQIDVGAVRDQRMIDPRGAGPGPRVATAAPPPNGGPAPITPDDKPKAKPVYKKWWFWAVVGVGVYVLYAVATQSSEDTAQPGGTRGRELPLGPKSMPQQAGGLTLLSW